MVSGGAPRSLSEDSCLSKFHVKDAQRFRKIQGIMSRAKATFDRVSENFQKNPQTQLDS